LFVKDEETKKKKKESPKKAVSLENDFVFQKDS